MRRRYLERRGWRDVDNLHVVGGPLAPAAVFRDHLVEAGACLVVAEGILAEIDLGLLAPLSRRGHVGGRRRLEPCGDQGPSVKDISVGTVTRVISEDCLVQGGWIFGSNIISEMTSLSVIPNITNLSLASPTCKTNAQCVCAGKGGGCGP